ncbi:MAG: hypothetical protein KDK39_02670 [Leptospiraceae bacterium]|nr:hypothetical protein [Leptospiraceae bacterium]
MAAVTFSRIDADWLIISILLVSTISQFMLWLTFIRQAANLIWFLSGLSAMVLQISMGGYLFISWALAAWRTNCYYCLIDRAEYGWQDWVCGCLWLGSLITFWILKSRTQKRHFWQASLWYVANPALTLAWFWIWTSLQQQYLHSWCQTAGGTF